MFEFVLRFSASQTFYWERDTLQTVHDGNNWALGPRRTSKKNQAAEEESAL